MEVDDPVLDAFESATRAQLRDRELGKIEECIPILWPKSSCPWVEGNIKSRQCSTRISMWCIISVISRAIWFGRITGRSWKIHRMDFSRVSFLQFQRMAHRWNLWSGSSGRGGTAIFTKSSCPDPSHGNFLLFSSLTHQRCFEIAYSRLCAGEFRKQTTVVKMDRCSWFGVYKGALWNSV